MRRRDFVTLVGGAAAWPLAGRAQPAGKLPTIGCLGGHTDRSARMARRLCAAAARARLDRGPHCRDRTPLGPEVAFASFRPSHNNRSLSEAERTWMTARRWMTAT